MSGGNAVVVSYTAKDFLEGVHLLDAWEELAYRRICDLIYLSGDRLPNDDRKLAIATKTGRRWKRVKAALLAGRKIFTTDDGRICNDRCRRELDKADAEMRKRSRTSIAQTKSGITSDNPLKNIEPDFSTRASERTPSLPSTELPGLKEEEERSLSGATRARDADPLSGQSRRTGNGRKSRLAADWMPSLEDCRYAAARGYDSRWISEQSEAFRDYHIAKGDLCASWSASWRTWVRRADDFKPRGNGSHTAARPGPVTAALDNLLSRSGLD